MNVEIQIEPIDEAKAVRGHKIFSSDFLCSSELVDSCWVSGPKEEQTFAYERAEWYLEFV